MLFILSLIFFTLHSIFRTKEKQEVLNSKRHMHRSLKFFGRPFGRSDSFSEDEDARGTHKSVHFKVKLFELWRLQPGFSKQMNKTFIWVRRVLSSNWWHISEGKFPSGFSSFTFLLNWTDEYRNVFDLICREFMSTFQNHYSNFCMILATYQNISMVARCSNII